MPRTFILHFEQVPNFKGPFSTVFSTESDSVVFYYSVLNLLRIVIHYSKDLVYQYQM